MAGLRALAVACGLLTLLPIRANAIGALSPESEEIGIDAEQISYDQKQNTIIARGAVVITRGTTQLRADEVHVNRTTNEADAIGNVSVTDPEGTIVAEKMHLNLDEETGSLEVAEIESPRLHYSLSGSRVEKGLGQSYHIENGRFTTCHCGTGAPSWSISGKDFDVSMGGYAKVADGTFNILDTPVLHLPRAFFPVQRDRESGFLTPTFGVSSQRGFQTLLPFYWAISKSHDATVALDVESSARAGLVSEYRYALDRGSTGVLNLSYFNESFRGTTQETIGGTIPTNRWSLVTQQTQQLAEGLHAYTDAFVVSDELFLRDINTYAFDHSRGVAIRTQPFTVSHAGILQLWDRAALKADATYYQNLTAINTVTQQPIPEALVGETLQRVPELSLWGQHRLGDALLGDLDTNVVDFQRGHGADGIRLDIQPGVTLPLPLGRSAFGSVGASVRETAYHLTDTTVLHPAVPGEHLAADQSREMMQADAEVGTALSRIYPVHWLALEKLKHTIEPTIQYLYLPAVAQGTLPFFDGTDRVNQRNLVTYGVVSRFIGRFSESASGGNGSDEEQHRGDAVRELGRLSITQSVDLSHEIPPMVTGRASTHFSDIDIAGRVNPNRFLSVRFDTNYDTSNTDISAARIGLFVEDPRDARPGERPQADTRTSLGLSYRFLTQDTLQVPTDEPWGYDPILSHRFLTQSTLQELDDNLVLRLTDWAGFLYSSRYDVVNNRFLDNFFGLRFLSTCDCWALDLAATDRVNPQEVEVRAQVTLVGLGSSTKANSRVAVAP